MPFSSGGQVPSSERPERVHGGPPCLERDEKAADDQELLRGELPERKQNQRTQSVRVQDVAPKEQECVRQAEQEHDEEFRVVRPDGTERYIHSRSFPIRDQSGAVYRIAGIVQDVTVRTEQDHRIRYLAYYDALTDLPNRVLVANRLEQAILQAHRHTGTHASASIGISVFPRDAEDAEMLVKHADAALRVAKEQGRNTFRFFSREPDSNIQY